MAGNSPSRTCCAPARAEMRRVLMCGVAAVLLAGCGSDGKSYTDAQIKAAYYRAADESTIARTLVADAWADPDAHEHTNYVPQDGIETCPQAQRANANAV